MSTNKARSETISTQSSSQADGRRRIVAAAAAELFDRQGFHTTSMNDVAGAVKLAKPSLYHYFPNGKAEILFLIHEEYLRTLMEAYMRRPEASQSASERLRGMMGDMIGVMDTHRSHVRVFFEYYRDLRPEQLKLVQENAKRYRGLMEDIIIEGIKSGEFQPTDVQVTTLGIFGMCNWVYQWYSAEGRLCPNGIAASFFELVLEGLASNAGSNSSSPVWNAISG